VGFDAEPKIGAIISDDFTLIIEREPDSTRSTSLATRPQQT